MARLKRSSSHSDHFVSTRWDSPTMVNFRRVLTAAQLLAIAAALGQDVPGLTLSHHAMSDFALSADPESAHWNKVTGVIAGTDPFGRPLPEARTEVRSCWT